MSDSDNTLDAVATVLTYALTIEFLLDTIDIEHADDDLRAILEPLRGREAYPLPEVIAQELRYHRYQGRLDDLVAANTTTGQPAGPPASLSDWADRLATFIGRVYPLIPQQRLTITSTVTAVLHRIGLRDDDASRASTGIAADLLT